MDAGRYRLGIDIGTSNTVAGVADPNGRTLPLLFDSSPLLPSAVYAGADGALLVGLDAERAASGNPAGLERNPKRRIDEGSVWLADRAVAVAELIAALLRRVAGEARRVGGRAPDEVVLTHPATWGPVRLGILADAAARAGLGPVRFTPEPVAAASYFANAAGQRLAAGRCLVVYDLGAGTFDATVLRAEAAGFTTLATAGLDDVGGLDLDAVVVGHARAHTSAAAADAWRRLDWPQTPADQRARQQLWAGAKAAKEQLSRHSAAELHVPLLDAQVRLTREEFDRLALPYLERTAARTLAVLQEAAVPPELVGGVYLVGGSSRLPLAATVLHRTLRIAPTVLDHPELVVAEGALFASTAPVAAPVAPPRATAHPVSPAVPVNTTIPVSPPVDAGAAQPVSPPFSTGTAQPVSPPFDTGTAQPVSPPFDTGTAQPVSPPFAAGPSFPVSVPPPAGTTAIPTMRPAPMPIHTPVQPRPRPAVTVPKRGRATTTIVAAVVIALIVALVVSAVQLLDNGSGNDNGGGPGITPASWSWSGTGQELFRDAFDDRKLGVAWHPVTGSWSISDGTMYGTPDLAGWQTVTLDLTLPADVVVHFRTNLVKDGAAEVMLHIGSGRYVRASLSARDQNAAAGDGHLNGRGGADGGTAAKVGAHAVKAGTWYDVTVIARGHNYTIAVDGDTVVDYTDTAGALSATGGLGFSADGTAIYIDDVTIAAV